MALGILFTFCLDVSGICCHSPSMEPVYSKSQLLTSPILSAREGGEQKIMLKKSALSIFLYQFKAKCHEGVQNILSHVCPFMSVT